MLAVGRLPHKFDQNDKIYIHSKTVQLGKARSGLSAQANPHLALALDEIF